jgi:cAMP phosphodiesterase
MLKHFNVGKKEFIAKHTKETYLYKRKANVQYVSFAHLDTI